MWGSLVAAGAQALPSLLGGGGSTEVSSSNTQSFQGSLSPTFNISVGGGINSDPEYSQDGSASASSTAAGSPLSSLGLAPSAGATTNYGIPSVDYAAPQMISSEMIIIGAVAIGAIMLMKGKK